MIAARQKPAGSNNTVGPLRLGRPGGDGAVAAFCASGWVEVKNRKHGKCKKPRIHFVSIVNKNKPQSSENSTAATLSDDIPF